jgi:hypothetical protein
MPPPIRPEHPDMSTPHSAVFAHPVTPIGEQSSTSLAQLLGLSEDDATLTQMREELDEIRDNEREAEKAVAHVRLN